MQQEDGNLLRGNILPPQYFDVLIQLELQKTK